MNELPIPRSTGRRGVNRRGLVECVRTPSGDLVAPLRLGVVIPAHLHSPHGRAQLDRCLAALLGSRRPADALVLVDDGSPAPIRDSRLEVLRLSQRSGPATARNRGVQALAGRCDVLVFVDADVEVEPDTLGALERCFIQDPGLAAVQTVYATETRVPGFASDFQNLLQHWNFARAREPFYGLSSFCVAVRAPTFEAVGGFDESIDRATCEDDNLGIALAAAGARIALERGIEVHHLAEFSRRSLWRRMERMACDKVRSIRSQPGRAKVPLGQTHHRLSFLFASAAVPVAVLVLPVNPSAAGLLIALALVAQAGFLRYLVTERSLAFAVDGAFTLTGLSLAAGLGSVRGLLVVPA